MSRPLATATRPQLALQSYLDGLLQDAASELELADSITLDEFEAAVLEEQVRDARSMPQVQAVTAKPVVELAPRPLVLPTIEMPAPEIEVRVEPPPKVVEAAVAVEAVQPTPQVLVVPEPVLEGRPDWAQGPFECLLFDVAGLTLAVPLVCLGSIYPLEGQELTPLFGQPDWFLGILPCQGGNLKVLDTARWVMPDRYRDDFREGLQYVISVQGYEWGLAVHQVSRSIRLDPNEVKWRSQRTQRPWLAGTVIEHMCALLDVASLAELIASGAAKRMAASQIH
ncbi:MAG: CheW domain-containing protein [Pseudomonas sp.]|uniref:CheW domain-containing protein n=1 Tax=Pseudomonas sp. TaxID=306 RepID=UPI002726A552|nr:CheW domain-containing protein [Pseudomonas sp.]MDO9616779.1 CheW domain-containing protein [Pseudomonas sp.]MDP2446339.1 CheW domain-containing protein [Pseudomonas sp.]MDZ4338071.1 CheW domain-containing protein [Pseudomonas sp.]